MSAHDGALAMDDPAQIAEGLTEAQATCGDVIDRLPCLRCGATTLRTCTLPMPERAAATQIINDTPGLHCKLLANRARLEALLARVDGPDGTLVVTASDLRAVLACVEAAEQAVLDTEITESDARFWMHSHSQTMDMDSTLPKVLLDEVAWLMVAFAEDMIERASGSIREPILPAMNGGAPCS